MHISMRINIYPQRKNMYGLSLLHSPVLTMCSRYCCSSLSDIQIDKHTDTRARAHTQAHACTHNYTHAQTITHTYSLTHLHTRTLTRPHTHTLTHPHSHTCTQTPTFTHPHATLAHSHTRALAHSLTVSLSVSLSLSLSLSFTHGQRAQTHTTHAYTHKNHEPEGYDKVKAQEKVLKGELQSRVNVSKVNYIEQDSLRSNEMEGFHAASAILWKGFPDEKVKFFIWPWSGARARCSFMFSAENGTILLMRH